MPERTGEEDPGRRDAGTTMVEVIVAFAVLVMAMGIFSQVILLSERIRQRYAQNVAAIYNLAGSCYLEGEADPEEGKAEGIEPVLKTGIVLRFQTQDGTSSFELPAVGRTVENGPLFFKDVTGVAGEGEDDGEIWLE